MHPISAKEHRIFFQQTKVMYDSGLGFEQIFTILAEQSDNPKIKSASNAIQKDLRKGLQLWEAIDKIGMCTPLQIRLLQLGETSGTLDNVFELLAKEAERRDKLGKAVMKEMAYPALVFHSSFLILNLPELFKDGGNYWRLALPPILWVDGLVAGVLLLNRQLGYGSAFRVWQDNLSDLIPIIGKLRRNLAWGRFCRAFAMGHAAGLDLFKTCDSAIQAMDHRSMEKEARKFPALIRSGKNIAEAMAAVLPLPKMMKEILVAGEKSGSLDKSLDRLADMMEEQSQFQIQAFVKIAGLVVFLCVAALVAIKIIGFYQGYFDQMSKIK